MKAMALMLFMIGAFALYGFGKLLINQSFVPSGYGSGRAPVSAKEDPDTFYKMLALAGIMGIGCFTSGFVLVKKSNNQKKKEK